MEENNQTNNQPEPVANPAPVNTVRTRMAPSPTGNLHLGTAYATLWPYLFAKSQGGKFIIRIEDTDQDRSTKEFATQIVDGLKWLGFDFDEGPYYQMERLALYQEKIDKLLTDGKAYSCFCAKEELDQVRAEQTANKQPQIYSGKCRGLSIEEVKQRIDANIPHVVRYKLPEDRGVVEYEDLIHGKIRFDSSLIGDFVIARQSGIPLYNFVVVVDDAEMKISHVVRGDDHVSNTPKQILLFEALGVAPPAYGHYPVILNSDRDGKLSKRTGATSIDFYKHEGYLPEAILNYLALLGWSLPGTDKEIWSKEELISAYRIIDMSSSAAAWDVNKLDWLNGEYIRAMSDEELTKRLNEYLVDHPSAHKIGQLVPLIKERIKKLSDFVPMTNFIFEGSEYDQSVFDKIKVEDKITALKRVVEVLSQMHRPWQADKFEESFRDLADELGIVQREIFQLIRVAWSGQLVTPPMLETMLIMGEDEVIKRVNGAIEFLSGK